jgi:hypothetical protein
MSLFGGNDQELRVTIKAKDEASQEIAKVNNSVGTLAKGFAVGAIAVGALRTSFRFLSGVISDSLHEFEEQNTVIAQTNAVLKSTAFAAGLTSRELIDMADALAKTTLYQDDMVLSAENMLLTFTNITKDIFPETTKTVLDMSTALGQDLKSSAIQLGKALNNPIEGVSALQRVGVSFTNAQQEMIATMVKSGRTMDAQKFILAELQKEFGGSAASAYEAASSITKLQKNMKELEEDIGRGLTPALNNMADAILGGTDSATGFNNTALTTFIATSKLGEVAVATAVGFQAIGTAIIDAESYALQFASRIPVAGAVFKLFGVNVDKQATETRHAVNSSLKSTIAFYDELKAKNNSVITSWGETSDAATKLKSAGPAAYQATAKEAEAAKKKMDDTKQTIADTVKDLKTLQRALMDDDEAAARAFAEQEQKVFGLRKDAANETDPARRAELIAQIAKEQGALDSARPQFSGSMSTLVDKERTRAGLTDFGRSLSDIRERKADRLSTDLPQIVNNISFNQVVAGDDGVRRLIMQTIAEINRQSTLRVVAGT